MSSTHPLAGFTVVEIGHSVAAPYTGLILASLGATVLKVENPEGGGDPARGWGPPFHEGDAPAFVAFNRNKQSLAVDLRDAAQRDALRQLILERADAVVCNLRAGSAESLGVGPISLREAKPELVYCEIGAFGSVGPMADKPGYDPLMQAYGGLMSITGESAERPPIRVGVSMIDMGAGLWGALGVVCALMERQRTGQGGAIETSLFETALAWTAGPLARQQMSDAPQKPQGSGAAGIVPYQAFLASDGWVVIGAGNDRLYVKLMNVLGEHELAADPRMMTNGGRVTHQAELIPVIARAVEKMTRRQVCDLLDTVGVPAAPVQTMDQVVKDAQTQALGIIQPGPAGAVPTVGLPLLFDGVRPAYVSASPALGAQTADWLPTSEALHR